MSAQEPLPAQEQAKANPIENSYAHSTAESTPPPATMVPAAADTAGLIPDYTEEQLAVVDKMNIGAAVFHGVQFVLMMIMAIAVDRFSKFKLPLMENYLASVWVAANGTRYSSPNADTVSQYLVTAQRESSTVAFGPMVACFFGLSCLAHVVVQLPCCRETYHTGLQQGRNYFRWVEYAISSTLMIWLICMLFGMYDISSLILVSICNATMNLLGLLQEQVNEVRNPEKPINWFPFALGCLCGVGPWIACFQYLSTSRAQGGEFPAFVWGVLFGYLICFNTFPVNMLLQYFRKIDYLTGEKAYIVLSFVAKCLLCWLVFSGTNQPNSYRDA